MVSPGEPAGIGPDIVLKVAQSPWPVELIVVSDPLLLKERAAKLNLTIQLEQFSVARPAQTHSAGTLKILPVSLKAPCLPGKLDPANAEFVLTCLKYATQFCVDKIADALVTGPVHKAVINQAGFSFSGHTEFLAEFCGVKQVIMLFVLGTLKVALATTHLPLAQVPQAITFASLLKTLRLLHQELQKKFNISRPNILVCGLNPHAGEMGLLGREEIDIITPVIQQLKAENMSIVGPLPADTIFIDKYLKSADAILAMYHDQALPVIKQMGFDQAVNITLGLPIIRTSVDHGTALDLAGTPGASPHNFAAALQQAIDLVSQRRHSLF